jgi:hypothetical protein
MSDPFIVPRKWKLKAHGQKVVFSRTPQERAVHVLMKAYLWALYLPEYPNMMVEVRIGDRYKPDVVSLDEMENPLFWGESGQVGLEKIQKLVQRYPNTHFAIAKWKRRLGPLVELVQEARDTSRHNARFDLISFQPDSIKRFIDADNQVSLTHDDLEWVRLEPKND